MINPSEIQPIPDSPKVALGKPDYDIGRRDPREVFYHESLQKRVEKINSVVLSRASGNRFRQGRDVMSQYVTEYTETLSGMPSKQFKSGEFKDHIKNMAETARSFQFRLLDGRLGQQSSSDSTYQQMESTYSVLMTTMQTALNYEALRKQAGQPINLQEILEASGARLNKQELGFMLELFGLVRMGMGDFQRGTWAVNESVKLTNEQSLAQQRRLFVWDSYLVNANGDPRDILKRLAASTA